MILRNSRYCELADKIKYGKKRLIIYGAGMIGQIVIPYMIEKYKLYDFVDCFVDLDQHKHGKSVTVGDYRYRIESPDILQEISEDQILLITNSKFYPVLDYLDGFTGLNHTEAYIIPVMQLYELRLAKKAQFSHITEVPVIPKKIHYCWFGGKAMPDFLRNCIDTWHEKCPDYEIIEWNEKNYDMTRFPYMAQAYEKQKYGFVTDVARLDILYRNGGIYLDTDVTLLKSLDELLYQPGFVGVEKWGNINTGGGCGAVPFHPMIKELLDYRTQFSFVLEDGSLNLETNGMYETIPFLRHGMRIDNTLQRIADITVYPSWIFHPYDYMSCETQVEEDTISKHHFYGGWMEKNDMDNRKNTQEKYVQILERMKGERDDIYGA